VTRPATLPLLAGERVHLRAMRQDDVGALFALRNDVISPLLSATVQSGVLFGG